MQTEPKLHNDSYHGSCINHRNYWCCKPYTTSSSIQACHVGQLYLPPSFKALSMKSAAFEKCVVSLKSGLSNASIP